MNKHIYRDMTPEQIENVFSNFLFDSFSFSKISSFARNEKAFEMNYIYNKKSRSSSSAIAGNAYHKCLQTYFNELQKGTILNIVTLQEIGFNYIDEVGANMWKLQKTTPTIEECKIKATTSCNALLNNFFTDKEVYEADLKEILFVEVYVAEFVTVNGVDIPLPCHAQIDLVIKTNSDKIVIIDHKSKAVFTDEKEAKFSIGKQAVTYVIAIEQKTGLKVDEVWFIENKISKNKDKSPQMVCFKIEMDKDTKRLYEAMLYEPLKRMLEAISNPDYVYLINESDNFVDLAEIYEFWGQTMLAEINDFDIHESKRNLIEKRLKKIRDVSIASVDPRTIKNFRENAAKFIQHDLTNKDMTKQQKIEHTLRTMGLIVEVAHTFSGYSSDTFLIEITSGTRLSDIFKYKLDIANALNVSSVRIMKDLFVYNGKSYLAVESGKTREKDLIFDPLAIEGRKIPLGVDNFGQKVYWNLENPSTPHVIISGSSGSGKSVCLFSIIEYAKIIGMDNIYILDPKFEFSRYSCENISVLNDIEDIETTLEILVEEMNNLIKSGITKNTLVIFDEFSDSVSQSKTGAKLDIYENQIVGNFKDGSPKTQKVKVGTKKSLEENLRLLLQKGRSSGYRIVAATQRASTKVITGDSKANFPIQIAFRLPKQIDSMVIIDESGAESLMGKGDALLKSPDYNGLIRFQAYYKI